jgi:hypothetical protein
MEVYQCINYKYLLQNFTCNIDIHILDLYNNPNWNHLQVNNK